jgi:para-aminobenzoate synthetase component 1
LHVQDVVPLPYLADPCGYFARIRHRRGAVLLDSARPYSHEGRFDLLSSDPVAQVESRRGITREWHAGRERAASGSPFKVLATLLDELAPQGWQLPGEWPFSGGAIGWFGYGLGARLSRTPWRDPGALPDLRVGIHGWALMQDHELRRTAAIFTPLVGQALRHEILRELGQSTTAPEPFRTTSPFRSNMDRAGYDNCVPINADPSLDTRAFGDYTSNYVERGKHLFPQSADHEPWDLDLKLRRDRKNLRTVQLEDGTLKFSRR